MVAEAEGGASRQYVKRGVAVWIRCRLLGDGLGIEVSHRGGMPCVSYVDPAEEEYCREQQP